MRSLPRDRIPEVAVKRLPVYLRVLTELGQEAVDIVSSADLARRTAFSSEQIRKDLAYFGAFGTRGLGYRTDVLRERIRGILGLDRGVNVALVGAGNLGTALARYTLSRPQGVRLVAVFDDDREKAGKKIGNLEILPMEALPRVVAERGIRLAILAVPAAAAQEVTDLLVACGIEAILNFSPAKLDGRGKAYIKNIDLAIELQSLAYYASGEAGRESRSGA